MKKRCFKCGRTKPIGLFYRHKGMADGHLGKCKACTKRDVSERYKKSRGLVAAYEKKRSQDPERKKMVAEYRRRRRAKFPGKSRASNAVSNAIRDGRLTRGPCEVCGTKERVQAHHDDYRKKLDVRWLCFKHHREVEHGQTVN